MTTSAPAPSQLWRWGSLLVAALGALAAASLAAASLWAPDAAPLRPLTAEQLREFAAVAAAFAAVLLACRAVVGHREWAPQPAVPTLPGRTEVFLVAVVIATGIALAAYYLDVRLRHDESRTIALYATQPLSVAASRYDDYNNHVFHTLLVWVAHQFGGWNWIVLRLPAFLSFCLLLPALWWFAHREYGAWPALFAIALVGASPFFSAYGNNARGYSLLLLLFVSALLCGRALVRAPNRTALWAAWAVAIALGLYTMPLMAFPAAATGTWMLLARWRRRRGDGFGPFLARTAAWSALALVLASALYLPVFATEGVRGVQETLEVVPKFAVRPLRLVAHPFLLWSHWHWTIPPWVQGALLALVVVGAGARGATCGGNGTLPLAAGLAWGSLMVAHPLLPQARMAIWALLVCMIMAGAGVALVVNRAVERARNRWPGDRSAPLQRAFECGALALVLGSLSWWTTRPDAVTKVTDHFHTLPSLPAMASAAAERMRPGDHFTICSRVAVRAVLYVKAVRAVAEDVGWYYPAPHLPNRWRTHRILASAHEVDSSTASAAFREGASSGRLFLFVAGVRPRCDQEAFAAPLQAHLEAQWPNHELIAAFGDGEPGGTGRLYLLNEWIGRP